LHAGYVNFLLYLGSCTSDFTETLHFAHLHHKGCKFGRHLSMTKGTLHDGKVHFLLHMGSCSKDFTETSHITLE